MPEKPNKNPPKGGKKAGGAVMALLMLILFLYAGYHAFFFLTDTVETERVISAGAEKTVNAEGIFFKTAVFLDNKGYNNFRLTVQNGEKVAKEQKLAVAYSGDDSFSKQASLSALEESINRLADAITQSSAETDVSRLDFLLSEQLIQLNSSLFDGPSAAYQRLSLIKDYFCRRAVVYEGRQNAVSLLAKLKNAKESVQDTSAIKLYNVISQNAGYFSDSYDDYKSLTPERLLTISFKDFCSLLEEPPDGNTPKGYMGSVVTDFKWYYGFFTEEKLSFAAGDNITLRFARISDKLLNAVVIRAVNTENGSFIAVESDAMISDFISLRKEPADIVLDSYFGLKISSSALQYADGQPGVYIRNKSAITFKRVTVLYDAKAFYIVQAADEKNPLSVTDDVVISGTDLFEGKLLT